MDELLVLGITMLEACEFANILADGFSAKYGFIFEYKPYQRAYVSDEMKITFASVETRVFDGRRFNEFVLSNGLINSGDETRIEHALELGRTVTCKLRRMQY